MIQEHVSVVINVVRIVSMKNVSMIYENVLVLINVGIVLTNNVSMIQERVLVLMNVGIVSANNAKNVMMKPENPTGVNPRIL